MSRFLDDRIIEHIRAVTDEPDLSATKYRMRRLLGRGGMGAVYLVEDSELAREVALKVSCEGHDRRLGREARVIARLEHPGIVPVHDSGVLPDGRVYYVMKLVRGERLDRYAHGRDHRELLHVFSRICDAVAFAHAHGVLHRDLKPENIMIGEFGEALVMDWGIAKADDPNDRDPNVPIATDATGLADTLASPGSNTATGTVMGTPAYMAPEQARGDVNALDARSDVYALGAILYFLLSGRSPFEGQSAQDILQKKESADPPRLAVARPLESIYLKAIAHAPEDRYLTALELSKDVRAFVDALPVSSYRENVFEKVGRFAKRHQVVLTLLLAYLLVRLSIALAR